MAILRDDTPPNSTTPTDDTIRAIHETMVRIRKFEERVTADYKARRIPGFTHVYIGEEAIAAAVCASLQPTDYITSTHRGHGHALAKGIGMGPLLAELYGKSTGACHGRGGSMHVTDYSLGMLGANGIVGGGFALAVGAGLSIQFRASGQVVVCFFGDGAINKGSFHEALNFASVMRLPVVFICENNGYAQWTATERTTAVDDLAGRACAYSIPGFTVDGNDAISVYSAAAAAVGRARSGEGPTLLAMTTYRFEGHSLGDPEAYRTRDDVRSARERDPIPRLESWMEQQGVLSPLDIDQVHMKAAAEVAKAVSFAETSPDPDPRSAYEEAGDDMIAMSTEGYS